MLVAVAPDNTPNPTPSPVGRLFHVTESCDQLTPGNTVTGNDSTDPAVGSVDVRTDNTAEDNTIPAGATGKLNFKNDSIVVDADPLADNCVFVP